MPGVPSAALPFPLRQALLTTQFQGTLEPRAAAFALHLPRALRFDPIDFDQIADVAGRVYAAFGGQRDRRRAGALTPHAGQRFFPACGFAGAAFFEPGTGDANTFFSASKS